MLLYALYITHIIYICLYLLYLYYIVLYSVPVLFGHIPFPSIYTHNIVLAGFRSPCADTIATHAFSIALYIIILSVLLLLSIYTISIIYISLSSPHIFSLYYIHSLYPLYSVRALYIVRIYINIIFSLYIFSPPWR